MASETIHVRRLRLAAPQRIASATLGACVEDALRCASLPAGWRGRIVLIRRLRLRADARSSPQQLARQIESQWQAAAVHAVPAARATAGSDAVWFDDESAARLLLIARLARGGDVSAWYWRRLLPSTGAGEREGAITAVLAAPWRSAAGAGDPLRFAASVMRAIGNIDLIACVLQRLDEAALQCLLPGIDRVAPGEAGDSATPVAADLLATHPMLAAIPSAARSEIASERLLPPRLRAAMRFAIAALAGVEPRRGLPSNATGFGAVSRSSSTEAAHRIAPRPLTSPQAPTLAATGLPSGWAGVFFLLSLWQQAGCEPESPAEAVAWLHSLAQRLRVAAEDGLWPTLAALDPPAADARPLPWTALRRASLAAMRLPLRRALRRSGCIDMTRTHLTVRLPLRAVDLRIRRAGLDLDPGWSLLLGRVVRFEYE
jgi:hypothetical protein